MYIAYNVSNTCFVFYLVWYAANPVGKTASGLKVKKLCETADIKGHYTNHSSRASTATRGLAKRVLEKFVVERTGTET